MFCKTYLLLLLSTKGQPNYYQGSYHIHSLTCTCYIRGKRTFGGNDFRGKWSSGDKVYYLRLVPRAHHQEQRGTHRESGACRRCKQPETLQHYLMQCPYTGEHRHRIFQQDDPMTLIYTDPNRVAQFIRSTDLMEPRPKPKPAKTRRKTPPDPKQPKNSRPH